MKSVSLLLLILPLCWTGCRQVEADPANSALTGKLTFDLSLLDEEGLAGPENGKRAITYEFCIPPAREKEVARIDPTARFLSTPGRVGCTPDQLLVLGHTHQPRFRAILKQLAGLPYVGEIRQAFFE